MMYTNKKQQFLIQLYIQACIKNDSTLTVASLSSDKPATSCLTNSTRSALWHFSNTSRSCLYVAFTPCFCFHLLSIATVCTGTDWTAPLSIALSSTSVNPRKGEIACQSSMLVAISAKRVSSVIGWFQRGPAKWILVYYWYGIADNTASLKGPTNNTWPCVHIGKSVLHGLYSIICLHCILWIRQKPNTQTSQAQDSDGHTLSTEHSY